MAEDKKNTEKLFVTKEFVDSAWRRQLQKSISYTRLIVYVILAIYIINVIFGLKKIQNALYEADKKRYDHEKLILKVEKILEKQSQ